MIIVVIRVRDAPVKSGRFHHIDAAVAFALHDQPHVTDLVAGVAGTNLIPTVVRFGDFIIHHAGGIMGRQLPAAGNESRTIHPHRGRRTTALTGVVVAGVFTGFNSVFELLNGFKTAPLVRHAVYLSDVKPIRRAHLVPVGIGHDAVGQVFLLAIPVQRHVGIGDA